MTASTVVYGVRAGAEATYGSGAALTDADYILLAAPPTIDISFIDEGTRGPDTRSGGNLPSARASGRYAVVDLTVHVRGSSNLATIYPLDLDLLLRLCGHRRYRATVDVPTVVYEPRHAADVSGFVEVYKNGKRYDLRGVYGTEIEISSSDAGLVTARVKLIGILDTVATAAAPAVPTYDVATAPIKYDGKGLAIAPTIGNWGTDCRIRSFKLNTRQVSTLRPDGYNENALVGVALGRRTAMLEVLAEAVPLSVFDPYAAQSANTQMAIALASQGDSQWWYVASELAQPVGIVDEEDGAIALWRMTFVLNQSGRAMSPYNMWFAENP